jgi:hypothetical protein
MTVLLLYIPFFPLEINRFNIRINGTEKNSHWMAPGVSPASIYNIFGRKCPTSRAKHGLLGIKQVGLFGMRPWLVKKER